LSCYTRKDCLCDAACILAEKLLKREKGVHAPGEDDVALQTIYNKDLRTYAIQYIARVMHKFGNGYVDLPVTCVLIKVGQNYADIKGVYRGVTYRAGFTQLPTLEQLFIDDEMAVRVIQTEYNCKKDYYGLDPDFLSNCIIGAFKRGYVEKKYGALFISGYKDHLVDRGMYESSAYQIFSSIKIQQREQRKISIRSQNQVSIIQKNYQEDYESQ
jgi:hypothetical protein